MVGITKEARIIKQLSKQRYEPKTPIATDMFLPNHSGDHSAGIANRTPDKDNDIANKKYVDDSIAAIPSPTIAHAATTGQTTDDHHAMSHAHDGVDGSGTVKLNNIENPDGDKTFNMTTRKLGFLFTNPSGNPVEFQASGAYTGALVHIHQHTGNVGNAYLLEIEASDEDVEHIKSTGALTTTHVLCNYVDGDATERFILDTNGKMHWGDGTSQDTYLYRDAANSLTTDGVLKANEIEVPIGTNAAPPIKIGANETGFYGVSDSSIGVTLNGAVKFYYVGNELRAAAGNGAPSIVNQISTATNPVYTARGDETNGIGFTVGSDNVHIIAGGVTGLTVEEDSGDIEVSINGNIITETTIKEDAHAYSFDMCPVVEPSSVSLALAAGGANLSIGLYYYHCTYYTADGETGMSDGSIGVTTDAANRKVTVTIPVSTDPRVVGRKIYRSEVGDPSYRAYLVTTIADNSTTEYLDDTADAGLGADNMWWRENTTLDYISYNGTPILMSGNGGKEPGCFFGYGAGYTTTQGTATGGSNVGIGYNCLYNVTSASKAVAIGYYALNDNTTGGNNVAVGHLAGSKYTSGANNIAIGRNSDLYNTTGVSNVMIGHYVAIGASSQSHSYNTIVGAYGLYATTTGGYNCSLGYDTLRSSTTGAYNVAVGYRAGYSMTTGARSIFIGPYCGYDETGSDTLMIDNRDRSSEALQREGAIIYGVMDATPADQRLTVNGNLKVNGSISSNTLTHTAAGPTDNLDVTGVNTLWCDCSANNITIGGFVGGVDGQVLRVMKKDGTTNDLKLEHNEGTGNQDIFLRRSVDMAITAYYGGFVLVCDGSNWYHCEYAQT